ncbi:hypothetical protein KPSA1_05936 [Pseudomonas syringae pv. actinidiae]|uniref:Uncharacterized protein n=1 Tax=Pseudomonas syringae pv. actinidiae TaxID=103796 RepID=A0A2V0QPA3_PSESF|nr:hypothetical protein KPSA1_05936 [Pseudomonas syringae pv. actinidiae]
MPPSLKILLTAVGEVPLALPVPPFPWPPAPLPPTLPVIAELLLEVMLTVPLFQIAPMPRPPLPPIVPPPPPPPPAPMLLLIVEVPMIARVPVDAL